MSRLHSHLKAATVLATAGLGGLIVAASLAGAAAAHRASGTVSARSARTDRSVATVARAPARIGVANTGLGKILVNKRGFTVYAFSRDARNKDRCAAMAGCLGVWPPVTTHGRPRAGHAVNGSRLGTIKISGGRLQVTYAAHPLYLYSMDGAPGQTGYVGASQFGGVWRALRTSGKLVT